MSRRTIRMWAIGRRIQYGLGFASIWLLVGVFIYFNNYYQAPNCFDLSQNGEERGVDCGGSCVRICSADVMPPQIVWQNSFEVTKGQYNAVAYVENQNQIAATRALNYTFQLLNNGEVVAERSGTTILPPNSIYPIFEGKIFTESRAEVTDTNLILEPVEIWVPASVGRDQFRSADINLTDSDTRPKLRVEIENTKLTPAENVEVVATVFNEEGEPVTASQTLIEEIGARSTENIVFTWPNSIAKTVRSCEVPTDVTVAIDLSGSMNNDGGTPSQPITDALQAASQFVDTLKEDDQVAVVTFASKAYVVSELNGYHNKVAETILGLQIDPAEESGFTNTIDALRMAQGELNSDRHNTNARRVLVLLTDGLPTIEGDEDVVSIAEKTASDLSENDIEIYAIGLGHDVDQQFVRNIASDRSNVYFAPTGADLDNIYKEITSSLCEVGPTKIDVIAKTETNFAELR